ncbi:MAG: hypothetical protein ACFFE2_09290 [Candidatus Thorarchaeota archaeon]
MSRSLVVVPSSNSANLSPDMDLIAMSKKKPAKKAKPATASKKKKK